MGCDMSLIYLDLSCRLDGRLCAKIRPALSLWYGPLIIRNYRSARDRFDHRV